MTANGVAARALLGYLNNGFHAVHSPDRRRHPRVARYLVLTIRYGAIAIMACEPYAIRGNEQHTVLEVRTRVGAALVVVEEEARRLAIHALQHGRAHWERAA